jgi:hypothetical protein
MFSHNFNYNTDINYQYQLLFGTKTGEDPVTVRGMYAMIP